MKDKEILKIVSEFTKGILGKRSSDNMCFVVCAPLHSYLYLCGLKTKLVEGFIKTDDGIIHHYWLRLTDGRIIDPTANQFNKLNGKNMPNIYFGTKPDWYKSPKKTVL